MRYMQVLFTHGINPCVLTIPHNTQQHACSNVPAGEWRSDPRLESLGQRIVLQAQDKPTSPEGEQETEGIEYKSWRIEHGVAEGDTEMPSGIRASSSIPLVRSPVPTSLLAQCFTATASFRAWAWRD